MQLQVRRRGRCDAASALVDAGGEEREEEEKKVHRQAECELGEMSGKGEGEMVNYSVKEKGCVSCGSYLPRKKEETCSPACVSANESAGGFKLFTCNRSRVFFVKARMGHQNESSKLRKQLVTLVSLSLSFLSAVSLSLYLFLPIDR